MIIGLVGTLGQQQYTEATLRYYNRTLRIALDSSQEGSRYRGSRSTSGGIALAFVDTEEQADKLRKRGGVIWHLLGVPSTTISIRPEDIKVPAETEKNIEEALSETVRRSLHV